MSGAEVAGGGHRGGQHLVVCDLEPGAAQAGGDGRPAAARGVGEQAYRQAGGAQPGKGRDGPRQRFPRDGEHAVHVEQKSVYGP